MSQHPNQPKNGQNIWNNGFQDTENQATKSSDSREVKDTGGELCYWPNLLPWQFLRRSLVDSWSWGRGVRVWGGHGPSVFRTGTQEKRAAPRQNPRDLHWLPLACSAQQWSVHAYENLCEARKNTTQRTRGNGSQCSHRAGNRAHMGKLRHLWDIGYSTQRVLPQ